MRVGARDVALRKWVQRRAARVLSWTTGGAGPAARGGQPHAGRRAAWTLPGGWARERARTVKNWLMAGGASAASAAPAPAPSLAPPAAPRAPPAAPPRAPPGRAAAPGSGGACCGCQAGPRARAAPPGGSFSTTSRPSRKRLSATSASTSPPESGSTTTCAAAPSDPRRTRGDAGASTSTARGSASVADSLRNAGRGVGSQRQRVQLLERGCDVPSSLDNPAGMVARRGCCRLAAAVRCPSAALCPAPASGAAHLLLHERRLRLGARACAQVQSALASLAARAARRRHAPQQQLPRLEARRRARVAAPPAAAGARQVLLQGPWLAGAPGEALCSTRTLTRAAL